MILYIRNNCNISSVYKYNIYSLCFARYETDARYEYKYANGREYEYELNETIETKKWKEYMTHEHLAEWMQLRFEA